MRNESRSQFAAPEAGVRSTPIVGLSTKRWFAVHVLPSREDRAEWHLRQQGFLPFVPRQKRTVRHARRLIVKSSAFFPGYMFVPLDLDVDRWRSINGTMGIRSLIMQGERPAPCPPGLVEKLIELTDVDGLLDFSASLEPGTQVRLLSGPFADMIGSLDRLDSTQRARVLLSIMGSEIAVNVAVKDLLAA